MEDNITIESLLDEEIKRTLAAVSATKAGTQEAKAELMKLGMLHAERIRELEMNLKNQQRIDASLDKVTESNHRAAELDFKIKQAEDELKVKDAELKVKDAELKETKKARRWKTALDILGITVPIAATGFWLHKGMRFEEEGRIYSSRTAQWLGGITRLFNRKG